MRWNTGFYQKENGEIPLKEFLRNLPEKHRAKAYWGIELLKEYGTGLREPYAKSLTGEQYKGLWVQNPAEKCTFFLSESG